MEWNAIDLHMHTVVGITGNGKYDEIKNFTYLNYVSALKNHNIKLAAITNHNIIDMTNYILCRYLAKKNDINLLFGVEIDSNTEANKNFHFVALYNEELNNCIKIAELINSKTHLKQTKGKVRYNPDDIIEVIKNYNCIMIPHGEKSKGLLNRPTEEEIIEALKKIREGYIRVFDNSSDWELSRIKSEIKSKRLYESLDDFGGVLFSDNRDWNNYDYKFKNFYMNAEPTFKGLLHSITNPTERFSPFELIHKGNHYISKIIISSEKGTRKNVKITDCEIEFKSGYNCIIGKSGAGKSLLLYLIKRELLGQKNNYFCADNNIVKIYDENNNLIEPNTINIGIGDNLYNKIVTIADNDSFNDIYNIIKKLNNKFIPRKRFNDFVKNYKNLIAEYISKKDIIKVEKEELSRKIIWLKNLIVELENLKDINSFNLNIPNNEELKYTLEDLTKIKEIQSYILDIKNSINILDEKDKDILKQKLNEFEFEYNSIYQKVVKQFNQQKYRNRKKDIIRYSLEKVNLNISNNANRKIQLKNIIPNEVTDIARRICKNYLNAKTLDKYDFSINPDVINSSQELVAASNIIIKETINEEEIKKLDIKNNNIFYTQGIKGQLLSKTYNMTDKAEARLVIDNYFNLNKLSFKEINMLFDNFNLETNVYFGNQNINELNPGDIAKTYIETYFNNELANGINSIILFDQIENDVDKEFINETIISLIKNTKKKAQVIIVTHDPIVAVNADPTYYIEATKNQKGKITYRSFVPESSVNDELSNIAKIVDGSKDVIRKRYEIYEGDIENGN